MRLKTTLSILFVTVIFASSCQSKNTPSSTSSPVDPLKAALENAQKTPSFENITALGLAYGKNGAHEDALREFKRALGVSPNSSLAQNNLCSAYNTLKRWDQGIEACEQALKLQPGFVLATNNLNYAKRSKTEQLTKISQLEKNIKNGKDTDRNRVDLGMEFYSSGQYEKAIDIWKNVPAKSDYYAIAQNDLASAYILTKQFELAKACVANARQRDPKNQLFLNNEAWLARAMKENST